MPQLASNSSCRLTLSRSQITLSCEGGSTLSIPLFSMTAIEVHQPIFGANYIQGEYRTEERSRRFTITFYRGGATEFASIFFQITQGHLVTGEMPHPPPSPVIKSEEDKKTR
ncbi:hypothetical protein EMCRGX_G031302 [Ephydatia muelleri]